MQIAVDCGFLIPNSLRNLEVQRKSISAFKLVDHNSIYEYFSHIIEFVDFIILCEDGMGNDKADFQPP